jgi:hypothetical protein
MKIDLPKAWELARVQLLPVLRTVTSPPQLVGAESDGALVRRPVSPFLVEALALDLPDMRVLLAKRHLSAWGVGKATAFAAAYENLPASDGLALGDDGIWRLTAGDGYDASPRVLPGWLAAFRGRLGGAPVAVAPHSRALQLVRGSDEERVWEMLAFASAAWRSEGEPISPVPYTHNERRHLIPWEPGPDAPPALRATVRAAARALAQREYRRLSEFAADYQIAGEDAVMATYEVGLAAPDPDGLRQPYGFCRFTRGKTSLLPVVDVVVLGTPDAGAVLAVRWEAFVRAMGGELECVSWFQPSVFRPRRWPEREVLGLLEKEALNPDELG